MKLVTVLDIIWKFSPAEIVISFRTLFISNNVLYVWAHCNSRIPSWCISLSSCLGTVFLAKAVHLFFWQMSPHCLLTLKQVLGLFAKVSCINTMSSTLLFPDPLHSTNKCPAIARIDLLWSPLPPNELFQTPQALFCFQTWQDIQVDPPHNTAELTEHKPFSLLVLICDVAVDQHSWLLSLRMG